MRIDEAKRRFSVAQRHSDGALVAEDVTNAARTRRLLHLRNVHHFVFGDEDEDSDAPERLVRQERVLLAEVAFERRYPVGDVRRLDGPTEEGKRSHAAC